MDSDSTTVVVARVGRLRGLRGEVVIHGEPDELGLLLEAPDVLLRQRAESWRACITDAVPVKGGLAVRFDHVSSREQAEALRGAVIEVSKDVAGDPTLDRFFWFQVEGFEVVTLDGRHLGEAVGRIRTGAHDVFVVQGDEREVLVPASPNVLSAIHVEDRRIVIDAIPGLLEVND